MKKTTVIGMQRSGTNYLEQTLRDNFKVEILNQEQKYLWKHHAYPNENKHRLREDHAHILMYKNPYKWIESLKKYNADLEKAVGCRPEHKFANNGLSGGHQNENDIIIQDKRGRKTNINRALTVYKLMYENWKKQDLVKLYVVKYEDLLTDKRKSILTEIQTYFGLSKVEGWSEWKNPKKVGQSDNWTEALTKKYLDMTETSLASEEIKLINSILGEEWISSLGYTIIE